VQIEQCQWTRANAWKLHGQPLSQPAQLVLVFGNQFLLSDGLISALRKRYPQACLFGCSTAGEIYGTKVCDETITATAVHFDSTQVRLASCDVSKDGYAIGKHLATSMLGQNLVHVLVLSDGLQINGAALVAGLKETLPASVEVTGGLAGDDFRRQETRVIADQAPQKGIVAALGLYGTRLKVGYGSLGGWDPFGPDRLVTRSDGNVLYELDGQPALALYKRYLGEYASGLPSTGLLFPLALRGVEGRDTGVIRSIRSINEADNSITSAGDIPQGGYVRLMKANFERLIEGAAGAASVSREKLAGSNPSLALLVSCVGRKIVLQQRIEEEVEGVRHVLGEQTALTGFYSYGEISPHSPEARCEFHNQTMTITTFSES
jgi:hypothetical protein